MKSFATMVVLAASAAVTSAQVTYNSTTGVFTCPASNPNGAFCAGDSLQTNIIIRCNNGVGLPGNCDDNLAGEPPLGVNYAPCWQTSNTTGDAACSKNCIVYGSSSHPNGTFTLPDCAPTYSSSSVSTTSTSSATSSSATASSATATTTGSSTSSVSGTTSPGTTTSTTITATVTTICTTGTTTYTSTYTTTYCPSSTLTTATLPTGTGSPPPPSNGTVSTGGSGSSPTATPVGPTSAGTASPSGFTGGAITNSAGGTLAAIGLIIAYFL